MNMRSQVHNLSPFPLSPLGDAGENCHGDFFSGKEAGDADGGVAPDGVLGSNIFPSTMRYENTEKTKLQHPLDGNFLYDGQPLLPLPEKDDCESDNLFGLEERTPIHEVAEQITASPPPYNSDQGLNADNGPEELEFMSFGLDTKNYPETPSPDDFMNLGLCIEKEPKSPGLDDLMSIKSETLPKISRSHYNCIKSKPKKQAITKTRKKACSMCRSSKTKCEGPRPCRRCVKLGRPEMCTPQTDLPIEINEGKECLPISRKRQRESEMHMEYDPYVCFAAGLVYKNNVDLLSADGFSVQISLKSTRKRLKDDDSLYKGQQCYRNSWCVRQFRHCGHCKSSKPLKNRKKSKISKLKGAAKHNKGAGKLL